MPTRLFSCLLLLSLCGNNAFAKTTEIRQTALSEKDGIKTVLAFINSYVENCNNIAQFVNTTEWVNSNKSVTTQFKAALKKLTDEANKQDPELGLDFDPIFDAQDYPDEGFELESFDKAKGLVVVKGKKWTQFKVRIQIVKEKGNWLVDGCGAINISN